MLITAAEARNWSHKKIDKELASLINVTNSLICDAVRFERDSFLIVVPHGTSRDNVDQIARILLSEGYEFEIKDEPLPYGISIVVTLT
jgi:hypothetical protein